MPDRPAGLSEGERAFAQRLYDALHDRGLLTPLNKWAESGTGPREAFMWALQDAYLAASEPTEDDPMPVFTIKAKDNLALDTVAEYQRLCQEHELAEQAVEVGRAMDEIRDWRARHPDRWKMPDHKHVPAARSGSEAPDGS